MKYTMSKNKSTITLDTESGRITGDTYAMRNTIKENFNARWDAAGKAWVVENLESEINDQMARLRRIYDLCEVEATVATTRDAFVDRVSKICPRCGTYCYGDCSAR